MKPKAHQISMAVRGKIGPQVYQRVRKGLGNIETRGTYDLQLRSHAPQTDRRSPAQLRTRARIAAATAAYKALDQQMRDSWRMRAAKVRQTGYNLFVRDFCRAHPVTEF